MTTLYIPLNRETGRSAFGAALVPIDSRYRGAAELCAAIRAAADAQARAEIGPAPIDAADPGPADAPAPIRPADVAPPGYAYPGPLATHSDIAARAAESARMADVMRARIGAAPTAAALCEAAADLEARAAKLPHPRAAEYRGAADSLRLQADNLPAPRYALQNRPADIGTIPRGIRYTVDPRPAAGAPHHTMARHGILCPDRELTAAECLAFELAPLIDGAALDPIADSIAADLADYAAGYLEQSAEDPEEFARAVSQRAERPADGMPRPSIGDAAAIVAGVLDRLRAMADPLATQPAADPLATESAPAEDGPDWFARIVRENKARRDKAEQMASACEPFGSIPFTHSDGDRYGIAGPCMSEPGRFRFSYFDSRGAIGHSTRDTLALAIWEGIDLGYLYATENGAPPATQSSAAPSADPLAGDSQPAPTRPDYADQWEAWREVRTGRADPDAYQSHLIDCLAEVKARGLFYNSETWPAAAALMFERHGYPDWREAIADNGVAKWFGTDAYNAGDVIRQRATDAANKAAADGLKLGPLPVLTFNDGKRCTGAVLHSFTHTGKECRITFKRGRVAFESTCSASQLAHAIERAAERAGRLKEKRERAKPAPVKTAATVAPVADPLAVALQAWADGDPEPDPLPVESAPVAAVPAPAGKFDPRQSIARWFRGASDAAETAELMRRGYLRYAKRGIYSHVVATAKGVRESDRPLPAVAAPLPVDTGAGLAPLPGESDAAPSIEPDVFIRRATKAERMGNAPRQRAMRSIVPMAGHTAMFKPYGHKGAGFYWVLDRSAPVADPVPGDTQPAAPVARTGRVSLILHNVLAPLQNAAPDGVPTVAGLESEARRIEAAAESMCEGEFADDGKHACALRTRLEYLEVARSLRELAEIERARSDTGPDPVPGESATDDDETAPAPLDGLDVAELGADGLAEFERAGGIPWPAPIARAYSDARAASGRRPGPPLRIPATDPRARIPARFAPVYLLQA